MLLSVPQAKRKFKLLFHCCLGLSIQYGVILILILAKVTWQEYDQFFARLALFEKDSSVTFSHINRNTNTVIKEMQRQGQRTLCDMTASKKNQGQH